jgi:hypothetical protein
VCDLGWCPDVEVSIIKHQIDMHTETSSGPS